MNVNNKKAFPYPSRRGCSAARPDCIHKDNVETIQAKLILQGANIPATPEAEARLHQRGVLNRSRKDGIEPRQAAVDLARERVRHAMTFRACG